MPKTFIRTKHFWFLTGQTAVVNFFISGFGSAQSLLRADQGTTLKVAGLHGTALGIASITSGFLNSRIVHTLGRKKTVWLGLGIYSFGLTCLAIAPIVQFTIASAFITGFGVSLTINNTTASTSEDFPEHRQVSLNQSNAIGISVGGLGILTVGLTASLFPDYWRLSMLISLLLIPYLYFFVRDKEVEHHTRPEHGRQSGKVTAGFMASVVAFFLSIACEFGISFWSAALLSDRVGSSAALSTLAVVTFVSGIAVSRWFIAPIFHKVHIDDQLRFAFAFQGASFLIFWLSHNMLLSLVALFGVGMGVAIQFPMFAVRIIAFSNNRPDLAIGYNSLAAGSAIAFSPFMLGVLGDSFGISRAYLMIPILIAIAITLITLFPSKHLGAK
jgi:MFS family permease